MAVVKELLRAEDNGTLSFGNYELKAKEKLDNFMFQGDIYKVKTFAEITKLERNGLFAYESVPGTAVSQYRISGNGVRFTVEGNKETQVIVEVEESTEYDVYLDGEKVDELTTNLGGKLAISLDLETKHTVQVQVIKSED